MVLGEASRTLDGASLVLDGASRTLDGPSLVLDGAPRTLDGASLVLYGASRTLGGPSLVLDEASMVMDTAGLNRFCRFLIQTATFSVIWPAPVVRHAFDRRLILFFWEPEQCGLSRAGFECQIDPM